MVFIVSIVGDASAQGCRLTGRAMAPTTATMKRPLPRWRAVRALLPALLASCATLPAPVDYSARAPRLEGYGNATLARASANSDAQQWFAQGVQQAYAFNESEAVRAFKAALALDPACALCAWGVAWQLGPIINNPMRGDLREAQRYTALALSLSARAAPREQGLLEAMAVRYGERRSPPQDAPLLAEICGPVGSGSTGGTAEKADPLDAAYAARLRVLAEAHPGDADIATLYAEAVMVATRSDWWNRKTGQPAGAIGDMVQRLEAALATTPNHTGANHYLIHALDTSPRPEGAVAAADRLGTLAPSAPHLVHMPSHIYARVSRFADAVRVNEQAVAAQARLNAVVAEQQFSKTTDWDGHNLHFLWFGAVMEGRGDLAVTTARRIAARGSTSTSGFAQYRRALPIHTLARFERWAAVLAEPPSADTGFMGRSLDGHARALALLRTGQPGASRALQAEIAQLKPPQGQNDGSELLRAMHSIVAARLESELALADGRTDAAVAAAQKAVMAEDAFEAREPPMLAAMARQAQGRLLLNAGRVAEAEAAFRADLADQPGSGWALRGLHAALLRQGRAEEASQVLQLLQRQWSAADPALRTAGAG